MLDRWTLQRSAKAKGKKEGKGSGEDDKDKSGKEKKKIKGPKCWKSGYFEYTVPDCTREGRVG